MVLSIGMWLASAKGGSVLSIATPASQASPTSRLTSFCALVALLVTDALTRKLSPRFTDRGASTDTLTSFGLAQPDETTRISAAAAASKIRVRICPLPGPRLGAGSSRFYWSGERQSSAL